jgi:Zn-dependent peptidase ImmA (M78 family)/transcriptional regulator with XRE-family HTH domain
VSVNGGMLRLGRQRRQLSQIDAAPLLGIDQSLLSRIENGLVEARDEVVLRAQSVYGLPRSFFYLTDPVYGAPVSVHPMWRRKADVSVREMDAIIAELNIRVFHLRRLLEGAEYVHANTLPRLDFDEFGDAEKIAALVRAHWKIPTGPIKNLTVYVEQAGVLVVYSAMGGVAVSGVTFSAPGLPPLIVLNSDQPADRLRYTLAHELGHLVMHRFPSPTMETEANEFASALLMPASEIRPYFIGRRVDLQLLAALKPEWRVSMQSLLMRAHGLGIITPNQAQYLWKQINARRMRLREPPELDFEPEQATVLDTLVRVHRESLGYSDADLAALLHYLEVDVRREYAGGGMSEKPLKRRLAIVK